MAQFETTDFPLDCGERLDTVTIAYETYGQLDAEAANAILVTHGTTSSHHAAGDVTLDRRRGWYDEVIGPGKLLDTDTYFVISSNVLGSCYGSTGPASVDPRTGRRYGLRFPPLTYRDIVRAQERLVRSLGIERLVAVMGSSIGGFQVFQWAVSFPGMMSGIIALDTATRDIFDMSKTVDATLTSFASDPNWNGGEYYESGGLEDTLTGLRIDMLKSFGMEEKLADMPSAGEREARLLSIARDWAREFDANSLLCAYRAWARFNVEAELDRIRAPILYILADTDEWFPARVGTGVTSKLAAAGAEVEFLEISSPYGHYATTEEPGKWVPTARRFLASVAAAGR